MTCPRCRSRNELDGTFCTHCGARLQQACPNCRIFNALDARFCKGCGHALLNASLAARPVDLGSPLGYTPPHLAEKILTLRSALEGERKLVTVLFCDLANSTPLSERLGPEAMHGLLNRLFELALAEVHRYEGVINQFLGDGFMALFGAPVAHEDHVRRAVLASLGIQRLLREHNTEILNQHDATLAVRIGLNTGSVVVGTIGDNLRMDYTAVGDTTNLAARLQQLAEPGTILVSESTGRLVRSHVRLDTAQVLSVKGKNEPVTAFRVLGLLPRRSLVIPGARPTSRFVGRDREVGQLLSLLEKVESGEGQAAGIVGEAGMGKSRLLFEFRQRLVGKRLTYLEGRCLSYGSAVPYLPLLDILRNNCGIVETDTPQEVAEKICSGLEEVGMDPTEWAAYLLYALGMKDETGRIDALSPEAIKGRTFDALTQMSIRGSRRRPIVFVVEDSHWIDRTSEEYFTSLVESVAGSRVLVLTTYRPGYRPRWMDKSYATQIALSRLSPADSLSVVKAVLAEGGSSGPLVQRVLSTAEGNPFFLEELARAVADRKETSQELAIPGTVEDVIMARIDRLADEPKRLLQTAAVVGREFSAALLGEIWDGSGAIDLHLRELTHLEFLYEHPVTDGSVFAFRHALTQEVAYASLLTGRRQTLHAAIGLALERLYQGRLSEVWDRLAYHYSKAERADKAVEYLTQLAEKAVRGYALVEATTAYRDALAYAERLAPDHRDRQVLRLVPRLGEALAFQGGLPEALDLLLRYEGRADLLDDPSVTGPYHFWLGLVRSLLGDRQQAWRSAERGLANAQRCGDEATMGRAYYVLATERLWTGRLVAGVERAREAVSLLERTGERWWLGMTYWILGWGLMMMGEFEQALDALARTGALGEAIEDPRLQSISAWTSGWILSYTGEWEEGIRRCSAGLERSPDPLNTGFALGALGAAYLEKGEATAARPYLEQAVQMMTLFQFREIEGWATTVLGESFLLDGEIERARELVTEGLEISKNVRFWPAVGVAHRTLGRIAKARGDMEAAEAHLNEARETFASIQARFELGRTHLAFVEFTRERGDPGTAARHLKEAHRLFTVLRVGKYVERAVDLARHLGFTLEESRPVDG